MFVSYTKHTQQKIYESTSFAIDNMYYVSFKILEQESIPQYGENKKNKKKIRSTWEYF